MADQLTSDELRQVLAEWLRPMRPKHRQKILGLAGLFEAVIARAEAAEARAYQRLEDALFAEQRATDADIRAEETDADASRLRLELAAAKLGISALADRVAELEAELAAPGWRPVTDDWPPYNERVIIGYGGGYGGGWSAFARRVRTDNRDGDDWLMDDDTTLAFESAVVAMQRPLPPAPQETE